MKRELRLFQIYAPWCGLGESWRKNVYFDSEVQGLLQHFECSEVSSEAAFELDFCTQSLCQLLELPGGWPIHLIVDAKDRILLTLPSLNKADFLSLLRQFLVAFEIDPQALIQESQTELVKAESKDLVSAERLKHSFADGFDLSSIKTPLLQSVDLANGTLGKSLIPCAYILAGEEKIIFEQKQINLGEYLLVQLAQSPLYDSIEGGFFRSFENSQAVRSEKLLIDNALMLEVIAKLYAETQAPYLKQVATEIQKFILEVMWSKEKASFASSLCSSYEYYALNFDDLLKCLNSDELRIATEFFFVNDIPSILTPKTNLQNLSQRVGIENADLKNKLALVQKKIGDYRQKSRAEIFPRRNEAQISSSAAALVALLRSVRDLRQSKAPWLDDLLPLVNELLQYDPAHKQSLREAYQVSLALFEYAAWEQRGGKKSARGEWAHKKGLDVFRSLRAQRYFIELPYFWKRLDAIDYFGRPALSLYYENLFFEGELPLDKIHKELCDLGSRLKKLGLWNSSFWALLSEVEKKLAQSAKLKLREGMLN